MLIELLLNVNGRDHKIAAKAGETLLQVLRDRLSLFSVREACGVGMCGSCTVLVEGKPLSACLLMAFQVEGKPLVTLEGLLSDGALHRIQEAFLQASGFQCSFCTPGFILTTKALLEEFPDPTDDQIREYLAGNLCRCGSYVKILQAVKAAKERS
jgi:aerobic carbon-monoxide dehydrogenase small subunit